MKKYILTLLALMATAATYAQYFSTKNGTELVYVNYDEAGQSTSTETMTVRKASKKSSAYSAEYIDKIVNQKSKNNTSYSRFLWTYSGGNTVCTEDLMYGIYIDNDSDPDVYNDEIMNALKSDNKFKGDNSFTLKDKPKGGEAFDDRSYSLTTSILKKEVTVSGGSYLASEELSTTAGKFSCIKITYLQQTKSAVVKKETLRITEWYAKGVGLVKRETYNTKGELQGKTLLTRITEK